MKKVMLVLLFSALSSVAQASPQFNSYWSGSYFFIDATNNENRSYSCSVTYTFESDELDDDHPSQTKRVSRTNQGNFFVQAKWSGNVLKNQGSWVNPTTTNGPNINCN